MNETEEAARNYYRVADGQDAAAIVALFADDAVYRRSGYPPFSGAGELMAFYGGERTIASGHHSVDCVVASGDRAAVEGRFHGVLRDGSATDIRFVDVFRFSAGKIAERHTYFDAPLI